MFKRILAATIIILAAFSGRATAESWCIEGYIKGRQESVAKLETPQPSEYQSLVDDISVGLGVSGEFKAIPCHHNRQVYAYTVGSESETAVPSGEYIIYDPTWVNQVIGSNKTQVVFLFGHEIGHLSGRHNTRQIKPDEKELEADNSGGCAVARLKLSFEPVREFLSRPGIRPVKADGTYFDRETSIAEAEEGYVKCGGDPPSCGGNSAWYICPAKKYTEAWRIALEVLTVEIGDSEVTIKGFELRTSMSDTPTSALSAINDTLDTQPSNVSIEFRTVKSEELPKNLGLQDYATFRDMETDSSAEFVRGLYNRYRNEIGSEMGRFSSQTIESNDLSVTIASDDQNKIWSVTTRPLGVVEKMNKGDSVLLLKEFTFPVSDGYFLRKDSYGYSSLFSRVDNGLLAITSASSSHRLRERTTRVVVKRKDGVGDPTYGLMHSSKSDKSLVFYHQDLEPASSVFLDFGWQ